MTRRQEDKLPGIRLPSFTSRLQFSIFFVAAETSQGQCETMMKYLHHAATKKRKQRNVLKDHCLDAASCWRVAHEAQHTAVEVTPVKNEHRR